MHLPGRIFRIIILFFLVILLGCFEMSGTKECYEEIVKEKVKPVDKDYAGEVVTVNGVKYPKQEVEKIFENIGCL